MRGYQRRLEHAEPAELVALFPDAIGLVVQGDDRGPEIGDDEGDPTAEGEEGAP